ncbi:hypothetical protein MPK66_gp195 [Erwinia phage pEa_SNUABM_2]|uniref:Uncharacterized protein n=1 Tax=Erwinia phage pEa_SNUABM_2 TaxID=2869547 RepID=A0AAE8C1L8_9CAUD|nr:hypothetical protein MPK66_gp195 [Erwinia phage pEa_SNUABM_2]QZE59439.1 hypothetical protein pEaSNUABM2_00195 [Erwinia phage pEa_SNUABM_2]QZE59775.1 hypothetical protein pEaSNUABM39_00195 [Erwinia phage pEa_SNUABM_39]
MSLIKINLTEVVASESAKAPSYKIAKVGGATTLVVNSAKKGELQAVVGHLKKAKASAIAGITASIKANTAATKAKQLPRGDKRTKLMATRKAEKAKSSADLKSAKAELREANKTAKAHGLGGLNLPLSAADIKTGVGAEKALKAIRSTKLTEFGVTGKRGTFKPKFLKEAAFDAVGTKAKKTPVVKPKVRMTDTERKNAKAPIIRNKNIVAGAHSPAKAKEAKAKRTEMLTGKKASSVRVAGKDPSPKLQSLIKTMTTKDGVSRGKINATGNSFEYKHGTASFRMSKEPDGRWKLYANFGGNGGGSQPAIPEATARKQMRGAVKALSKLEKPNRMDAQVAWQKGIMGR